MKWNVNNIGTTCVNNMKWNLWICDVGFLETLERWTQETKKPRNRNTLKVRNFEIFHVQLWVCPHTPPHPTAQHMDSPPLHQPPSWETQVKLGDASDRGHIHITKIYLVNNLIITNMVYCFMAHVSRLVAGGSWLMAKKKQHLAQGAQAWWALSHRVFFLAMRLEPRALRDELWDMSPEPLITSNQ